ncbi:MAG: DUF1446 domain-containing protein [Pseudolabrys sp.]|nr:DUF1446 domain-containing protein [Pseudolabrys sp.]
MAPTVFIGCGAGFAGDRTDAAGPVIDSLAACDGPRFIMFEMLAERTLALAQLERRADPAYGYNRALVAILQPILARCLDRNIKIIGNFGAANPRAAAERMITLARELGLKPPRIAVVEGDDISGTLNIDELARRETDGTLLKHGKPIVSANVYLGAQPIARALDLGAQIVVTGRVADSALALGPLMHAFGWSADDWDMLAAGTMAGHLLECGAQVTGGYYADPGFKDVPHLDNVGYPIAEISSDGAMVITKPHGTGGLVNRQTVVEQLLYEIHDPASYLVPDVVLDITDVSVDEIGPDRVRVSGSRGKPAPPTLKATVCLDGGVLGEAEISYAGINAPRRAKLAAEIIAARMRKRAPKLQFRTDMVGEISVHGTTGQVAPNDLGNCRDVRLRFAAGAESAAEVAVLLDEVEALYCAGPAGGAGVRRHATPRLISTSCLIERDKVMPRVSFVGEGA